MLYFVCNEYLLFVHHSVFNEIPRLFNADIVLTNHVVFCFKKTNKALTIQIHRYVLAKN